MFFRRTYFGLFKGRIFTLLVLADAVIGKLLIVLGTGSDLQIPSTKFQEPEERTSKVKPP